MFRNWRDIRESFSTTNWINNDYLNEMHKSSWKVFGNESDEWTEHKIECAIVAMDEFMKRLSKREQEIKTQKDNEFQTDSDASSQNTSDDEYVPYIRNRLREFLNQLPMNQLFHSGFHVTAEQENKKKDLYVPLFQWIFTMEKKQ
jgi:hypothetical protein